VTAHADDLVRTVDGRLLPAVGEWAFEAGNSAVTFTVKHLMISKVRGSFREFSGHVHVGEKPEDSSVLAELAAASIDTGMAFRDRDLRGKDFLDAEQYPHLVYRSRSVAAAGKKWRVEGDLTIATVTRPVTLDMEFGGAAVDPWGHAKAVFTASTEIVREDFGLVYNQAIEGGGVLIGSRVKIDLEIQAKQVPADAA
jgi:polyisoprenoid-binding protein YceI